MEVKAVRKYAVPSYPPKEEILRNPQLLKALPERWKSSMAAGIALSSLMLLTLTACGSKFQEGKPGTTVSGANNPSTSYNQGTVQGPHVSPVFIHGNGRGGFGCVSVAPPAFLSEEEAFQIIREEAEKLGVKLEKGGPELVDVQIPVTNLYPSGESSPDTLPSTSGKIELDGFASDRKIGYEFISVEDVKGWHKQGNVFSSVESYDFLGAARTLHTGLEAKKPDAAVGVFYDPASMLSEKELFDEKLSMEDKGIKLKELAEEELRLQVRDFLDWLKGQGVI